MVSSFLAVFLFILLSYIPELFLIVSPVSGSKKRVFASHSLHGSLFGRALHILFVGLIFLIIFMVTHRPYFAMLVAIGAVVVLVIVSNAKYKTLREPLVFSDISMFSQAFKHPRLYLPFLGIIPAMSASVIAGIAIYIIFKYEPAFQFSLETWIETIFFIILCLILIKQLALKLQLAQEPASDIKQHGLLASMLGYSIQARTAKHKEKIQAVLSASLWGKEESRHRDAEESRNRNNTEPKLTKPNIILIQSESFFDARRLHESIDPLILKGFDKFCEESRYHGKLNVPAWGANTMRTEFSVLTSVPSEQLGFYRFYPYQYLSKQSIPSLASYLSQQGYYCVCVHPHPASFFGRDRIFPKMGFDEFIDIESFDKNKTFGPYISDQAVTEKVTDILQSNASNKNLDKKPLFIFAITMENHGPLHLEKTDDKDIKTLYNDTPPVNHNDLTVYLRHLNNADSMLKDLRSTLTKSEENSILCFYGDHVPSMPKIYEAVSYEDESADYFIWQSDDRTTGTQYDMDAENMAERILETSISQAH